ncbi:MAG: InlB B-repeat-containing protein [Thomasclavelia sp.]|nr:InlB B-repeat-containing protein [Thomasclavelia sp.]
MKKIKGVLLSLGISLSMICSFSSFIYAAGDVELNSTNFPDPIFLTYVTQFDLDSDGNLSQTELDNVTQIELSRKNVSDLKGIEHFSKLVNLYCDNNLLTSLDLSHNTELKVLVCNANKLSALDVSNCSKLTLIECSNNNISALDVSNCLNITTIVCFHNNLSKLDVSKNTSLKYLDCGLNKISNIDLTNNTELITCNLGSNNIDSIDVTKNMKLIELNLRYNSLKDINLTNNAELTKCNLLDNNINSIDVTKNMKLKELDLSNNNLKDINLSNNTVLYSFDVSENKLTNLDVSNNIELEKLLCSNNDIKNLDLSKNSKLELLVCFDNDIKSLDLSKNSKLNFLMCHYNGLTSLDLGSNTKLGFASYDRQQTSCFMIKKLNGKFVVDMKEVVESSGGDLSNVTMSDGSTLNKDGTITYASLPSTIKYDYNTKCKNPIVTSLMEVIITPKLKYQVVFEDGDGNTLSDQTIEEGKNALAPKNPTKEGYEFNGWDKDYSSVKDTIVITPKWKKITPASNKSSPKTSKIVSSSVSTGDNNQGIEYISLALLAIVGICITRKLKHN